MKKIITENDVQGKINSALALKRFGERNGVDYVINSLEVNISNELNISFDISLSHKDYSVNTEGMISGQPQWKSEERSFYFLLGDELNFSKFDVQKKASKNDGLLTKALIGSGIANRILSSDVMKKPISSILRLYFKTIPVYRMEDDLKEKALSAILIDDSLRVVDNQIQFEYSISQSINKKMILIGIASLILISATIGSFYILN